MSKSLGNIIYAKDFIENYSPMILRMLFLLSHYRKPIDINRNVIENAKIQMQKIKNCLRKFDDKIFDKKMPKSIQDENFIKILENDLDTANAVSYLMLQVKKLNKEFNQIEYQKLIFNLEILGFDLKYLMQIYGINSVKEIFYKRRDLIKKVYLDKNKHFSFYQELEQNDINVLKFDFHY